MGGKSGALRMRPATFVKLWPWFLLIAAVMGAILCASSIASQTSIAQQYFGDTFDASYQAYEAIHRAEVSGANVTTLIPLFNSALDTLKEAQEEFKSGNTQAATSDAELAKGIFNTVRDTAEALDRQASIERSKRTITTVFLGAAIVAVVTLTCYGLLRLHRALQWKRLMRMEIHPVTNHGQD